MEHQHHVRLRRRMAGVAAVAWCGLSILGISRASSALPVRPDAQRQLAVGHPLIDSLLTRFGGRETLQSLDDWFVEGDGRENLSAELQGVRADRPTWRPHYESIAVRRSPERVSWSRRSPRNDLSVRDRRMLLGQDSSGSVDFVTGQSSLAAGGDDANDRQRWRRRIPHLLALEAATASHCTESESSQREFALACRFDSDSAMLTLRIRRRPIELAGIDYRATIPGMGPTEVRWRWFGWHVDSTIGAVPRGHTIDIGDQRFQELRYRTYSVHELRAREATTVKGRGPQSSLPVLAGTGADTGLVAPRTHLLNVEGFRVLVAEFSDFILLADAPEAHPATESVPPRTTRPFGYVSRALRTRLRTQFPLKPLRYIVVSHHHSDHLGGLGGVVDSSTIVLAAPGHAAAVRRALATWPGERRGNSARVRVVAKQLSIRDDSMRVDVINVGANPHTTENLITWLPESRVLFQGDLFYFNANAPFPPSGRARMNTYFADWLVAHRLEPRVVYGAHNRGGAGAEALARATRPFKSPFGKSR